eukprot:comp21198_c0_seq1/m.28795 comp21198_c0_seq1/g.28795  ORF comp21198_c0_seq1/g.28795 comp21198_c0_seq1/m.28795 type:complete len:293 (-) comp21198_c0_seq1:61-939(-)
MTTRRATHAGSWYTDSPSKLSQQLTDWLAEASPPTHSPARAIIAPHAGYSYCGSCAGYAYRQIDPSTVKRVFILGPSHHVYLSGCALSQCTEYATPIGNLTLDQQVIIELRKTGKFDDMDPSVDEDEHSIEMHLPYVCHVMKGQDFTIVPILVGALTTAKEKEYGTLLAPYLNDPHTLWVVSSDFCHWGRRFSYTYHDTTKGEIHSSIRHLDHMGMTAIESRDPTQFASYQKQYKNTICGRHPIAVLLNALATLGPQLPGQIKFLNYAQSSKCYTNQDSSVSYAAASFKVAS